MKLFCLVKLHKPLKFQEGKKVIYWLIMDLLFPTTLIIKL